MFGNSFPYVCFDSMVAEGWALGPGIRGLVLGEGNVWDFECVLLLDCQLVEAGLGDVGFPDFRVRCL